jgi:hypothetical protein
MALSDLGWRRTFPLRVHVARLFNPPEARERLGSIRAVSLDGGSRAEALLFALWLAARLGWRVGPSGGPLPAFTSPSGDPLGITHAGEGDLTSGFRVGFSFGDRGTPLEIQCGADGCVSGPSGRSAYRPVGEGEALLEEVDSLKQDGLFLEVVAAAAAGKRGT